MDLPDIRHIKNASFVSLHAIKDGNDGRIAVIENNREIPFEIKRVYYIYHLIEFTSIRGKHAHKKLEQVLFCVHGSFEICLDDGENKVSFEIKKPETGVYIGTELWHTMTNFSNDCVLLVLASDYYSEADYIRNYNDFKAYLRANQD